MEGWKGNLLNQAGKEVLIKAVIQAIPSYIMSILILPKTFCESLTSMVANFWWKSNGRFNGIHWKKFETLCFPKGKGGLGFKDYKKMNIALLTKQVWRMINDPNSYWASTLKAIYFPTSSFWESPTPRGASWVWKSFIQGKEFLKSEGRWIVGPGTTISISQTNWLSSGGKALLKPNATATTVAELMDGSKKWDFRLLRQNLQSESAIEAVKTPISWLSKKDELMWPHNQEGTYSTKSGYTKLIETSSIVVQKPSCSTNTSEIIWKLVWSAKVPTKIKHFLWKVCQNIIPTRENLYKKRIPLSQLCPICLKEIETIEHIFLLCEWTKPLWFGLQLIPSPSPLGLSTIQNWLLSVLDSPMAEEKSLSSWIFFTFWVIWNTRNDLVFNGKTPNPLNSLHRIKMQCTEFLSTTMKKSEIITTQQLNIQSNLQAPPSQWRPPQDPFVKFNCDAAFDQATGKGFTGIIARNSQGHLLTASTSRFYATSPLVAEALSLRDTVSLAANLQFEHVIFESDNKSLIEACNNNIVRREIQGIIQDINCLRSSLPNSGFTWTKREGNGVAHTIAALAREDQLHGYWTLHPPSLLRRVLVKDAQALWK